MRKTAVLFEPEFTANNSVRAGLTVRFWSESNAPRPNVASNTPIPPTGVLARNVGLPLPAWLKSRMKFAAVLFVSAYTTSEADALQGGIRAAAIEARVNKKTRRAMPAGQCEYQ